MTELILCIVLLFFLGWVFTLKCEIARLRKENDELRIKLKTRLHQLTQDVKIAQGPSRFGMPEHTEGAQTAP